MQSVTPKLPAGESAVQTYRRSRVVLLHFFLWLLLAFQTIRIIAPAIANPSFGISTALTDNKDVIIIQDFSSHFNFVQKTWLRQTTVGSGSSIYSAANHLKVTSDWAGTKVGLSPPFGYSPTMRWVLAPLVPFSHATLQSCPDLVRTSSLSGFPGQAVESRS